MEPLEATTSENEQAGILRRPGASRTANADVTVVFDMKQLVLLCAIFCAGCDFPPAEAETIRQELQAGIARGQVYIIHSSSELSYVIKNSEFNRRPRAERDKLVDSVEHKVLEVLRKNRDYDYIKIYFLGDGTKGIDKPYICRTAAKACSRLNPQGEP